MGRLGGFRNLLRDQRGNALVVVATTMPLLVGAAAISIDTINLTLASRQLQRSADSAALAGAFALAQTQTPNASVAHDLALNNHIVLSTSPLVENAPATGPYASNPRAVRVVLTAQRSVPFIAFFRPGAMTVTAEATASLIYSGQFCVIALERNNATGVTFAGNATANLGCGVMSNSTGPAAVSATGSSSIVASPIAAVGQVPASGSFSGPTTLLPYSIPQADPYANLPVPAVPTPCLPGNVQVQPNSTRTLNPGCYSGIDIKGTVTFTPGVYIIDGGTLAFGATAVANGDGVTFILTSHDAATNPSSVADISMHANAVLNLKAPTSGTYQGLVMYQDRRALDGSSQINGNSASVFQGGFYFPSRGLTFNGNAGVHTECVQFVARRLTFSGNSQIQNVCPAASGSRAFDGVVVRLVG